MKKKLAKALTAKALELISAGYSVIPVMGKKLADEPKRPGLRWGRYQQRSATEAEVKGFFADGCTGIGVVCGSVSRLLVVDFDDRQRYRHFCKELPQYKDTYTVKTKRGFHVYFRTSEKVPSHQFQGGDIKGERSYVVGAGSVLPDLRYEVARACEALEVGKADVERLLSYFHVSTAGADVLSKEPLMGEELELEKVYRRLAPAVGRNNALYRTASMARDAGWSLEQSEARLLPEHSSAAPNWQHRAERKSDRWQEGKRTIASAFRRGPGRLARGRGVPNSVRERLLRSQGSSVMARLLDAFVLAGWEAERAFTLQEACRLGGQFGLSRKSVLQALTGEASIFNGRHIISRRYVAYLDSEGLKSGKRGRPVSLMFRVPSVAQLLDVLGCGWSPSDAMEIEDIKSARAYRLAVHREYIRRVKGQVTMGHLARRMGVSARTVRRYNRIVGASVRASVGRLALSWGSVWCLPGRAPAEKKNATKGYWLELPDGSRMPAWRHIGVRLLREAVGGVQVCLRRGSVIRVDGAAEEEAETAPMQLSEFLRARARRDGDGAIAGLLRAAEGAATQVSQVVRSLRKVRYRRSALTYESVARRIADDKVAESIGAYLVAYDGAGREVRRPARRGVAFRMLKEFGNGEVFLALRDAYEEMTSAKGRGGDGVGWEARWPELLAAEGA